MQHLRQHPCNISGRVVQFYLLLALVEMGSGHGDMSGAQSGLSVGWAVGLWWSPECFW